MEYFINALKKYAEFTGRTTRKEFWMFILFYLLIYIGMVIVDSVLGTMIFTLVYALGMFVPSISISARRLHDTGRTGWWQLIGLIPLIGLIVLIVFYVQESQGDNAYGSAPAKG
jgi:uncharacterized membrane protein YhaH (DUF805 family)